MVPMRAQDVALVQGHGEGSHKVIPVPHDGHGRLVFSQGRLVRVLPGKTRKKNRRKLKNFTSLRER